MNVLYLLYDGLTDSLGRSQVLPYILGLREFGHSFTIVSCEKQDRFQEDKKNIQKIVDEAGVKWVPLTYTGSPPVVSTVYDVMQLQRKLRKGCTLKTLSTSYTVVAHYLNSGVEYETEAWGQVHF